MPALLRFAATTLVSLLCSSSISHAQDEVVPLTDRRVTWPNIPYQVSGANAGPRGPQAGYNRCNSTTEGPNSLCQTSFLNSLDDFCFFAPQEGGEPVGNVEAKVVSWCTKKGHGTRVIPAGAITGAQWLYAKNYVQVVGYIDQTKVNLVAGDYGGELDPHGADEQGNPLGGLFLTSGFGGSVARFAQALGTTPSNVARTASNYTQSIEWHSFIGGNTFCLKLCNPASRNDKKLCEHVFDRYGCAFNILADYSKINGTFETCDSDDALPPGVYVGDDGETTTWNQGPRTTIATPPFTPVVPSSSNCRTYTSAALFGAAAATTTSSATTSTSTTRPTALTNAGGATRSSGGSVQATQSAAASIARGESGSLFFLTTGLLLVSTLIGGGAVLL